MLKSFLKRKQILELKNTIDGMKNNAAEIINNGLDQSEETSAR